MSTRHADEIRYLHIYYNGKTYFRCCSLKITKFDYSRYNFNRRTYIVSSVVMQHLVENQTPMNLGKLRIKIVSVHYENSIICDFRRFWLFWFYCSQTF